MLTLVNSSGYAPYAAALLMVWLVLGARRTVMATLARVKRRTALGVVAAEPVSLHPFIDPKVCIGCGACTHACPEGRVISIVEGKASLTDPGSCIGHGACKTACPVGAIELVFGTARRGIDLPVLSPQFETTVPGLYVAGELGGMGLIANAIAQGRKTIETIATRDDLHRPGCYDVVIVGAGPAGIAASLAAQERRLSYLTLEQDSLGGTVAHYPRQKIVMTRPAQLPLVGKVRFKRVRKERLLTFWRDVLDRTGLVIHEGVRVTAIRRHSDAFIVSTSAGDARASAVVLATGRRGSPRKLDVPGEDMAKVAYMLVELRQYRGQHVLVAGGGNSAIEAALALAGTSVASVTLAYRGRELFRVAQANRKRFAEAVAQGRVRYLANAHVREITADSIMIDVDGSLQRLANDAVIICTGGTLPEALLSQSGVACETKHGTA